MKIVVGSLMLTIAVFINFIQLSSQSGNQGPHHNQFHELPLPRFSFEGKSIRMEEGRPHAHPVINNDILLGISEFGRFYPTDYKIDTGEVVLYNLKTRKPFVVSEAHRNLLFLGTPFGSTYAAHQAQASSSNQSKGRKTK